MAGSLNETHLKSIPQCNHGSLCVLKTGTSQNANRGKSFFICNNAASRCSYATAAVGFEATVCPKHEKMVELKAFAKKENGIRCYYRCVYGKEKGETWCGNDVVPAAKQPQKKVLKDITNHFKPTEKTKDRLLSKVPSDKLSDVPTNNIEVVPHKDPKPMENTNTQNKTVKNISSSKLISESSLPSSWTGISESMTTSIVDMTSSAFNVPRSHRISDVSDASSVDTVVAADNDIGVINSSMLSVNEDNDCNTSSVDVTQSSADIDQEDNEQADTQDASMISYNNKNRDTRKKSNIISDTESDDSDDNNGDNDNNHDHLPQNDSVDCVNASMLSNLDDNINEITNIMNSTSIQPALDSGDESDIEEAVNNETNNKRSNIIEISDSSDDDEVLSLVNNDSNEIPSADVRPRMSSTKDGHIEPISVHRPNHVGSIQAHFPAMMEPVTKEPPKSAHLLWNKIQSLKVQRKRQQDIYAKMARVMPDGGMKLFDSITVLTKELDDVQKEYTAFQKAASLNGTLPINVHYPVISKNGSVHYTNAHQQEVPIMYPGHHRPAPLFGGRMTDQRLTEVKTITKNTIEQLHQSLDSRPSQTEEADDPKLLKVTLMRHQKQALAWLLWRERQIPSGGILADDMGLGKTLTMISLALKSKQDELTQMKEAPKDSKLVFSKGSVIICPASLIHQWQKEVEKRVKDPTFTVYLYHGANREKKVKRLAKYDIVLTTYNIASIEGKKFSIEEKSKPQDHLSDWLDPKKDDKLPDLGPLFQIFWRRIILDEGHTIKNHKTTSSIAICNIEGESRWIVTGTPIQNNTMELYSLIKFIRVPPFDELKVWKREVDNKMVSGTKRMNSLVASLLLRRTKDQVDAKTGKPLIILPKRSTTLHKLKLSPGELQVYELVQYYSKKMFKRFLDTRKEVADGEPMNPSIPQEKEICEMPKTVLGIKGEKVLEMLGLRGGPDVVNNSCLLVLVLRLRQCCTHLSLMCEQIDPELCKDEGIETALEDSFQNLSIDHRDDDFDGSVSYRPKEMLPNYLSSKISTLMKILSDLRAQSSTGKPVKSVIVSQWTRMLEIVAYHLKVAGYKYDFITGGVNVKKRSDLVDSFNNEKYPEIMLVSLKAGGVGLNLIGGSNLFILDQHWNPALEDQASDRIYRVGQRNDVTIHRFLCTDTVEERIAALQEKKKALANSVLYGGKMVQKLSLADLKMIFGLGM